jgi:ACR3 family arsenite efflux pump ArsB
MQLTEKLQILSLPIAIITGFLLSNYSFISDFSNKLISPFLFLMLLSLFINIPLKDFKTKGVDFKLVKISILINFIWTPILAYILSYIFLDHNIALCIGFIMLLVTPCTDWYLMFTDLSKGNMTLSLSILPLNLILQLILLPVYLFIFTGVLSSFDLNILIESILLIVILPFIIGQIIKYIINKLDYNENTKINSFFEILSIIFLALAIFAMFASEGKLLIDNSWLFIIIFIPYLLFFLINFILIRLLKIVINLNYPDYVSLTLTTLARNSPISLAIAVTAFPNEPIIALSLVISPLIELPILTIISGILKKTNYQAKHSS